MTLGELHEAVTKLKEQLDEVMSKTPGVFKQMPVGINIVTGGQVSNPFLFNQIENGCITHGIKSLEFVDETWLTLTTQEIK